MANLPVIERATRALKAQLETMTLANGYDFDVRHVYRKRDIPERADDPPEIHLLFGPTTVNTGYSTHQVSEIRKCYAWFILRDKGDNDEDLYYNQFVANLQSCLGESDGEDNVSKVIDSSNPLRSYSVGIYQVSHLPRYAETRKGYVVGRFEFDYEYIYLQGDPYKWDTLDAYVSA